MYHLSHVQRNRPSILPSRPSAHSFRRAAGALLLTKDNLRDLQGHVPARSPYQGPLPSSRPIIRDGRSISPDFRRIPRGCPVWVTETTLLDPCVDDQTRGERNGDGGARDNRRLFQVDVFRLGERLSSVRQAGAGKVREYRIRRCNGKQTPGYPIDPRRVETRTYHTTT